jgi:hypothetical protein
VDHVMSKKTQRKGSSLLLTIVKRMIIPKKIK